MTMIRKLVQATINTLGPDEVEITMSTAALARDGHILIPQGCVLDNYRANPIVLWQHDPEHPVASAENIQVEPDSITARVRFAPDGISHKADEVRGLVKAGIVRAVSVGFDPIDGVPLDPKKPRGGQEIHKVGASRMLILQRARRYGSGRDSARGKVARSEGENNSER